MRALIIALALTLTLTACETLTPNKGAVVTSEAIYMLGVEVDLAEKRGWISNEREDELINKLIDANNVIKSAYTLESLTFCEGAPSREECVQAILTEVELALREAENGGG